MSLPESTTAWGLSHLVAMSCSSCQFSIILIFYSTAIKWVML